MDPNVRSLRLRLLLPAVMVILTMTVGTVGYHFLWRSQGGTWLDALFMTVTTVTTIGYGEVKKLDDAGRVFTMLIALTGIGSAFYLFSAVMDSLVTAQLLDPRRERKMRQRIEKLQSHIVLIGLGRVGTQAALELVQAKVPFVVIDPGDAAVKQAEENGYLTVKGDGTVDEVLKEAGVDRAKGVIVTTRDDAANLYIVLSARLLNPKLHIVSRASDDTAVAKLTRAGANRAISPYAIGGRRIAQLALSPTVVDFFETALGKGNSALNIEDLVVRGDSKAVKQTLEALRIRQATGATILAVMREDTPVVTPRGDLVLGPGDHLLALGTEEQLKKLEELIGPSVIG
ncbi:MAG TPA: potassium channel protein [Myxococcaceae bacterium]|nr:potassium channel protein [Myxococcaceae bacterium]